ncbi:MAG: iron-containing alcohol dehydrogenase, partial [Oscillospiraceae bacterium]
MSYTNCLPAWSVGPDCYKDIYDIVRRFGKSAAVIGGKTALEKAYAPLRAAMADTGFKLSPPIWYGGNSTYENVAVLEAQEAVRSADMLFAVGGGRAVDTCKAVADHLDKPIFTFPTIASNCAGCTAIGVFYNADDTFRNYFYPTRCPEHTFINTQIIAEAPEELLWAGIGDALSKECEVELATRKEPLFHTT